jgi:hypothetical protein
MVSMRIASLSVGTLVVALAACGTPASGSDAGGADGGDGGRTTTRVTGTWTASSSGTMNELRAIWGPSPTELYAVGTETLRRFNGTGWVGDPRTETFSGVSGAMGTGAIAVGGSMGSSGGMDMGRGVIVQRVGSSWTERMVGMMTPQLQAVFAVGTDAWAVGNGTILRSMNTGAWMPSMPPMPAGDLYSVHGTSPTDVWVTGEKTWHWDGTAWTQSNTGTTDYFLAIHAIAPDDVWGVGVGGAARRWDGTAWTNFPAGVNQSLYALWARAGNDVWAAGEMGVILHFNGAMWERVPSGTTRTIRGLFGFADTGRIWAVGENGTLLSYTP